MDSEHGSYCFSCLWFRRKQRAGVTGNSAVSEQPLQRSKGPDDTDLPDAKTYAFEAGKKTIEVLKSVSGFTGVPLLNEVLDIGLHVIDLCEGGNEVQERVSALRNRVAEFLLVTTKFMKNQQIAEKTRNFLQEFSTDIESDLIDLKTCLDSINEHLQRIRDQNIILTTLLPESNISQIEHCEILFQDAIDRFQTLRGLRAAEDLGKIQAQLEQIQGEIQAVSQKVDRLQSSVDKLREELKVSESGTAVPMPELPSIFYGRTDLVNKLAEMLCTRQSDKFPRICLLGPGGLGKTSTALYIMEHKSVKNVFGNRGFWVDCTSAPSPSALLSALARSMGITQQGIDIEASIFSRLALCDSCVMLLDNFETPWHNNDNREGVRKLLRQLDSVHHVAILLTMRSEYPPLPEWHGENLDSVSPADSHKIYATVRHGIATTLSPHAPEVDDPDLNKLFEAVGHMPYAVSLLATLAKHSLATPIQLLREWQSKGIGLIDPMSRCISLSVKSSFVQDSVGAIHLLQVLSMLPAGTPRSHLGLWLSTEVPLNAIDTLRDAALIQVGAGDDPTLFVLPVVQSYMQNDIPDELRLRVCEACFKLLRDHEITFYGPNTSSFKDHAPFIALEERNVEALLTNIAQVATTPDQADAPTADQMYAFQVFVWYQFWVKPGADLAEKLVKMADRANNNAAKAEALLSLGCIHAILGHYMLTLSILPQAQELFWVLATEEKTGKYKRFAVICSLSEHKAMLHLGTTTLISFRVFLQQLEEDCQGDEYLEAHRLQLLGHVLFQLGIHSEIGESSGLLSLATSRDLFSRNGYLNNAAFSSVYMASLLRKAGKYMDALKVLDVAIEMWHRVGFERDVAFLEKALTLKSLNQPDDVVLETLHLAFKCAQRQGALLLEAQALEQCGEVYVMREDWPAAILAYEEARMFALQLDDKAHQDIPTRCKQNLRYIEKMQMICDDVDVDFVPPPEYYYFTGKL